MSNIGVWLDRSKAIIIRLEGKMCHVVTMKSDFESVRYPRCGTEGHCTIIPENRMKQHRHKIVRNFYLKIIETIQNAQAILILGPGIAKSELLLEIEALKQLRLRVLGVETADKMSQSQIELKVKNFFKAPIVQPA